MPDELEREFTDVIEALGQLVGVEPRAGLEAQAMERVRSTSSGPDSLVVMSPLEALEALSCAVCHDPVQRLEATFCTACETPHHGECYAMQGQCGCGSERFMQLEGRRAAQGEPLRDARLLSPVRTRSARLRLSDLPWSRLRPLAVAVCLGGLGLAAFAGYTKWSQVSEANRNAKARLAEVAARHAAERAEEARRARVEILRARLPQAETLLARRELCDQALRRDPTMAIALVARAQVGFALARREAFKSRVVDVAALVGAALEELASAERVHPTLPELHLFKAELLLIMGQRPRALASLSEVTRSDAEGALGALALGIQERLNRRLDRAIDHCDSAIARDPKLVEAYVTRARAYLSKYDYSRALQDAERACALDPLNAESLSLRAEARYLGSGDRERSGALRDLGRALALDPTHSHAWSLRAYVRLERSVTGMCVSGEGDMQTCEDDANQALRLNPDEHLAFLAKSQVARARQDEDLALRLARVAVEKGRHSPEVYLWRARLRGVMGDHKRALDDAEQVLRLTEDVPSAARVRALALTIRAGLQAMALQNYSEARRALERALELDPNLPEAYFYRGFVHHMDEPNQQLKSAIQDYSAAISRKPDFVDAIWHRAAARFDMGRYEDSLDDLELAEGLFEGVSGPYLERHVLYLRGRCYFELEDWESARRWLEAYREKSAPGEDAYQRAKELLLELEQKLGGE